MPARPIKHCLACGTESLVPVIDLGYHPVANNLLTSQEQGSPAYPLALNRCPWCSLLQLTHCVDRQDVFSDAYPYRSGVSKGWQIHCEKLARSFQPAPSIGSPTLLDIGGNDGTAATAFREQGYRATVMDPCADGPDVIRGFFSESSAKELDGLYTVVLAQNVLAHVEDPADFLRGVAWILDPIGDAIIECPLQPPHTDVCQVYHEHVTYWNLRSMEACSAQAGLVVTHVQHLPEIHGGSMRYFLRHAPVKPWDVWGTVRAERVRPRQQPWPVEADGIGSLKADLCGPETIWAIGASAKLATLLSLVGPNSVAFVIDDCAHKQGKYLPTGQPILPPQNLAHVSKLLIGSWNWAAGLKARAKELGFTGEFIVPFA